MRSNSYILAVLGFLCAAGSAGWAQEGRAVFTPRPPEVLLPEIRDIDFTFALALNPQPLVTPPALHYSCSMFDQLTGNGEFEITWRETVGCACRSIKLVEDPSGLDVIFGIPDTVIGILLGGLREICSDDDISFQAQKEGTMLTRVVMRTDFEHSRRPFSEFVVNLVAREQGYFAGFQDTSLGFVSYEEGLSPLDTDELYHDQVKVLFDVSRKTYLGSVNRLDSELRGDAFNPGAWRSADFVVGPLLLGGYTYLRGWERKVTAVGLEWRFNVEPLGRIWGRLGSETEDLASATSLEVGIKSFPVKFIISSGIHDGGMEMDFIGVGTGVGMASQAVRRELESEQHSVQH